MNGKNLQFGIQECNKCKYYLRCEECGYGKESVAGISKEVTKEFVRKFTFNLLNNSVIDGEYTLKELEFDGEIIEKTLNDTLKQFGVEVGL